MIFNEKQDEEAPADPSGVTRLSDLSEEDAKSIRPILLMELTAQCDYSSIQVRKRKVQKGLKKNLSGGEDSGSILFGIPLEQLLVKDRQLTGDSSLEVPIIFEKVRTTQSYSLFFGLQVLVLDITFLFNFLIWLLISSYPIYGNVP